MVETKNLRKRLGAVLGKQEILENMKNNSATFRFYEELNDFLPIEKRKVNFVHHFLGNPAVKDTIESLGVPHTEVDLIIVNDHAVNFSYQLKDLDRIAVYPIFEAIDITDLSHLRPKPLRTTCFVLDVHLGKLARYLRLLGFDVHYEKNYSDEVIIEIAVKQRRIILTRDVGLLKNGRVTHGYWLRNTNFKRQVLEILTRFDLYKQINAFTRCLECNGLLQEVDKERILHKLPPETIKYYESFWLCAQCGRVYWQGPHFKKMQEFVENLLLERK